MDISIIFMAGVFAGISVTTIIFRAFLVGILRIDTSDHNDNPYMFLELSKGISKIVAKKYVILKVNTKNLVPHK